MKKILIFIALSAAFCISANPVDKICRISGNVAGRSESKEAVIIEADEDFRVVPSIKVPIIDGHFSLQLPADTVRQYQMLFDDEIRHGSWRSRYFFAEGDSVSLKADGEDKFMVISDSPENRRAKAYDDLVEEKYGHAVILLMLNTNVWNSRATYMRSHSRQSFLKHRQQKMTPNAIRSWRKHGKFRRI